MKRLAAIFFLMMFMQACNGENEEITQKSPELTGSQDADTLIQRWNDLNSHCRGGSGDDPKTLEACDERDQVVGRALEDIGWCYGKEDQAGYQMQWHKCEADSLHHRSFKDPLGEALKDALDSIDVKKIAITNIGSKEHLDLIDPSISKAAKAFISGLGYPATLADGSKCVKKTVESDVGVFAACLSEHHSESQVDFSYLAVAAKPYEDDWTEPAEYHAATAYLKFFIFRGPISIENKLAESDFVPAGSYGTPTNSIKLIKFKRSGPLGWAVEDGYAHMGYVGNWTVVYGLTKGKINLLANISSYASNADSGEDTLPDDSPEHISMNASVFIVDNGTTEYFPIEAGADGISHGVRTQLDTQIYFSESSNSYVVPDDYKKLFEF
jgi:hypothetical protein